MTLTYVLLGDPVEHSASPELYAAAFRLLGFDACYRTRRVSAAELGVEMRRLAAQGGGGNVTLPHKLPAALLLDERTESVSRTGACNCFWGTPHGSLAGDNTDVGGFLRAARRLTRRAGSRIEGAAVLVLGAGGAARAVLVGLAEGGAASVDILNRSPERALRMLEELQLGKGSPGARVLHGADEAAGRYDLVINATSLGLRAADRLPLDLSGLEARAALDCVYGPLGTRWTRHAAARGIPATDGLAMLVEQARLSVRNWLGIEPDVGPLQEAVTAGLAGRQGGL
jgi:shikimate dehydrogenase